MIKLDQAKSSLVLGFPFFGSLVLNCRVEEDNSIPTMATDGKDIFYNKDFVKEQTKQDLMFILAHEVMHKVLVHPMRLFGRNAMLWNVAGDYVINRLLELAGMVVPDSALYDIQYDGMTADEVYRKLEDEFNSDTSENSDGEGEGEGGGQEGDGTGSPKGSIKIKTKGGQVVEMSEAPDHLIKGESEMSKGESKQLEQEMKQQLANAAAMAKSCGNLPDAISKLVDGLLEPKVNWKEQLQQYIRKCKTDDRSFSRPNRRMKAHGVYLPSCDGEEMPPITLVLDTSGSIYSYEETLKTFISEMNSIIEDTMPEKVYMLNCDTKVSSPRTLMKGEPIDITITGGGGTAFSDAFDYINENQEDTSLVVFFTDLYVSDFGDTDKNVLWVVHDGDKNNIPPFGEVLHIDG